VRLTSLGYKGLLALFFVGFAVIKISVAQTCVDDDGDGWGWNQETSSSCRVAGSDAADPISGGGIRVSWPANSVSENVSEYEAVGQVNDGPETGYYRGSETEFSIRLTDISAVYNDTVCIRVRAIRLTVTGSTTRQTNSDWSMQSCITVPEAPLQPPQMIELSIIE